MSVAVEFEREDRVRIVGERYGGLRGCEGTVCRNAMSKHDPMLVDLGNFKIAIEDPERDLELVVPSADELLAALNTLRAMVGSVGSVELDQKKARIHLNSRVFQHLFAGQTCEYHVNDYASFKNVWAEIQVNGVRFTASLGSDPDLVAMAEAQIQARQAEEAAAATSA